MKIVHAHVYALLLFVGFGEVLFLDHVLIYSPNCPGTHYLNSWVPGHPPASTSLGLGLYVPLSPTWMNIYRSVYSLLLFVT